MTHQNEIVAARKRGELQVPNKTGRPARPGSTWYPDNTNLKRRGDAAIRRIAASLGKEPAELRQFPSGLLYKEVDRFRRDGIQMKDIAFALGLSKRRIEQVVGLYEGRIITIPKVTTAVNYEGRETEWSTEAFIAFFNRFSGMIFPPHARPWVDAFMTQRNLILNVPPRHAKSTIFATWIPIWLICRDRNVQIILVSETHAFAKGWATEIAGQLELNLGLIEAFGEFTPPNKGDFPWRPNQGEIVVRGRTRKAKGAQLTLQSRGSGQQILGMEADFVIADDPTNAEIASSETERRKEVRWFQHQVLTRIEPQQQGTPGGRAMVIGQRVHLHDLYGYLAAQRYERGLDKGRPLWHVESYPAISRWPEDNDGVAEVLWPERWNFEELMVSYERVGGLGPFYTMYQQQPSPEGAQLIRSAWVEGCKDYTRDAYKGVRPFKGDPAVTRVLSLDPSPDNYHGIVVGDLAYDPGAFRLVVLESKHMRSGLRDLIAEVRRIDEQYDLDYFVFEQSTFSKWFFEDPVFREFSDNFRIIKHKTTVNKRDAEYGIQSLATDFEFRHISLPYGDADARRMTDLLATEAINYPEGLTDDILHALWFIKYNHRRLRPMAAMQTQAPPDLTQAWSWYSDMARQEDRKLAYA